MLQRYSVESGGMIMILRLDARHAEAKAFPSHGRVIVDLLTSSPTVNSTLSSNLLSLMCFTVVSDHSRINRVGVEQVVPRRPFTVKPLIRSNTANEAINSNRFNIKYIIKVSKYDNMYLGVVSCSTQS